MRVLGILKGSGKQGRRRAHSCIILLLCSGRACILRAFYFVLIRGVWSMGFLVFCDGTYNNT
jgi:hypothetical protein